MVGRLRRKGNDSIHDSADLCENLERCGIVEQQWLRLHSLEVVLDGRLEPGVAFGDNRRSFHFFSDLSRKRLLQDFIDSARYLCSYRTDAENEASLAI